MPITSPYNFVPLNKFVYIPSWHDKVSQDIPFEDGEDGWIEVKWRNESPLFIRDASVSPDKAKCVYSMHIKHSDGKRLYFIPGSSMKGMLRNIITILSYGKMTQYNNRFFGYREFNTKGSMGKKYQSNMQKAKVGWLEKSHDKEWNDVYRLYPCKGERDKITIEEVKKQYGDYGEEHSSWKQNTKIKGKRDDFFPKVKEGYRLFCTGYMNNKKHEMLIPKDTYDAEELTKEVVDTFLMVYEPSPDFGDYMQLLDDEERIPVSFVRENGKVKAIGLGRMFRYPYKQDVQMLVENEQDPKQYGQGRDLAETMFGWAERNDSMKGRVQFGNAFASAPIADAELREVKGVLGQPKASFYPLYVKQTSNPYKTYEDATTIAGRKLYRVHQGASTTALPQGNGNENTCTTLRAVPTGQEFTMRINLHNVLPIEVGALLWAITFNGTPGVWHNIGQAKSFGYGKLACKGVSLNGLNLTEREYLQAFEREMTRFATDNGDGLWRDADSVTALVNILSEHTDADVRMMKGPYRKTPEFSQLREGDKHIVSTMTETALARLRYADLLAEAEQLHTEGKLKEAKNKYEGIAYQMRSQDIDSAEVDGLVKQIEEEIDQIRYAGLLAEAEQLHTEGKLKEAKDKYEDIAYQMRLHRIDSAEVDGLVKKIEEEIDQKKREEAERLQEMERRKKEAKLNAGISAILDEKYDMGPNAGTYKVKDWKLCCKKVDKWLKDKGTKALDDTERAALASTVARFKANHAKKEDKDWANPSCRLWQEIAKYLGEEETNKLKQ